jgi:large subunit ribosomal protein L9
MKLLLKEDIKNLGLAGDLVTVKDGYGRNFLLPRSLAVTVNPANARAMEAVKKRRLEAEAQRIEELRGLAEKIAALEITLAALVSEGDNLYGSISERDIIAELAKKGVEFASFEAEVIVISEPLKTIGEHTVGVKLHPEVKTTLKVIVTKQDDGKAE